MPTIATQIVDAKRAEKVRAQEQYRELIKRFDRPLKQDGKKMLAICGLLGISLSEVEADAAAITRMPGLLEKAARVEERQRANMEAGNAVKKARRQQKDGIRDLERAVREALHDETVAAHRVQLASDSVKEVDQLAVEHWRVFQAPKPQFIPPRGLRGRQLEPSVLAWLDEEPMLVRYPHAGDRAVVGVLTQRGYTHAGHPDLWSQSEETDDGPTENS